MQFKEKKLTNGLTIIGEVNSSAKSAAVGFFVKTGSRDETVFISGVSHFLEHMLFKGTDKLSPFEVNEAFDRTGAQFNAFTSEENTVFYSAVLPEYLAEVTGLWSNLMRPALRTDDFNMEKNVIKEEIAMYKDQPSFDVMDRCRALHFKDHPCGNSVLGTEETIDNMTADQMRNYFQSRYSPDNITVTLAGNFDWDKLVSLVEENCSAWIGNAVPRNATDYPGSHEQSRLTKKNLNCEHICLMSPSVSFQDPRRFAASLLSVIIGDDVGSRFFWEIVDPALAETASMQFSPMDGTGTLYTYVRCAENKSTLVLEKINSIFADLRKNGVTADELSKAKNKVLSALVIKNEISMGRLIDLGFNWTYLARYFTIAEEVNSVKSVTLNDISALLEQFNPADFTKFSIAPEI